MLAIYGLLLIALGLWGYIHAGSAISAGMGSLFGLIALICYWQQKKPWAYWVAFVATLLLCLAMLVRSIKTGGAPAPVITVLLSAAMGLRLVLRHRI